ncbi:MAG: hypothetical protein HND56_00030 [Pseudomonadota bacterium]|nr:hypothetical protein [Pseudomonadota bacterium]QKK04164.1 MAG: hypothetical protein HND56_00030 [Pseudomonadota bacterium]
MQQTTPQELPIPLLRKIRYGIEAAAAYTLYGFFKLLPVNAASATGGFIGRMIGPHLGASKKAYENLALAFPDKTDAEKKDLIRKMWDNMGRTIAEYPHLVALGKKAELVGGDILETIAQSDAPAILVAAHLGNWEVGLASVRQQRGFEAYLTYRRLNNPLVDRLLSRARESGAEGQIHKKRSAAIEMMRLVKDKKTLAIMIDQKLNEGIAVPFFGHDAMTIPFPAQLALKHDCPLYPARIERIKGTAFRVTVYPALEVKKTGDTDQDIRQLLQDMNHMLEGWIHERPEQWLWLHRRWPREITAAKKNILPDGENLSA